MKYTDIAIIGGGLAGSTAAAMLGRAGIPTVLIDPHQVYPFDFRVEKISGDEQLDRFYQTGIADSVLRSATHDGENWIARFGYLLDKKPSRQYGIMYDALIGAIRAEIASPGRTHLRQGRPMSRPARSGRKLTLSDGEMISARLVVLANGLNVSVPAPHDSVSSTSPSSAASMISLGFDLVPVGRPAFEFPVDLLLATGRGERIPYPLVPGRERDDGRRYAVRSIARLDDPWLRDASGIRARSEAALRDLRRITGEYAVAGDVKIRPGRPLCLDRLSPARGRPVGDAFAATCRGYRHRHRQRCSPTSSPALQRPYPRLACDRRHERRPRSLRFTTIRSRSDMRRLVDRHRKTSQLSARSRSRTGSTGVHSAGRASWRGSAKAAAADTKGGRREIKRRRAHSSSSSSSSSSLSSSA